MVKLVMLTLFLLTFCSGCSHKRVMKDCEKSGIENYYFCAEQYKIWR